MSKNPMSRILLVPSLIAGTALVAGCMMESGDEDFIDENPMMADFAIGDFALRVAFLRRAIE